MVESIFVNPAIVKPQSRAFPPALAGGAAVDDNFRYRSVD